ncbi:MAG: MoaD/ThiS family protein [Candidatus Helarchaeota archaeon]
MTGKKIKIELLVFATLRDILGFSSKIIEIPSKITINQFLQYLRDNLQNGQEFYEAVFDKKRNEIRSHMRIIIDGHILLRHEIPTFQIQENCKTIAIFPPVGGG